MREKIRIMEYYKRHALVREKVIGMEYCRHHISVREKVKGFLHTLRGLELQVVGVPKALGMRSKAMASIPSIRL